MLQTLGHSDQSTKAKLSVAAIIPLYNGAAFIREALESVLAQTDPADEIIVVNDGSNDDGPAIVEDMASRHPIKLISQANGGIGAARNRGVAESKSTHIALLDQDDIWSPDHNKVLKRPFIKGDIAKLGVVYANLDHIDRAGRMLRHNILDDIPHRHPKVSLIQCLMDDMTILPGAALIDRESFTRIGGFDDRLSGYEDDDLFLRMFSAGYRLHYLRKDSVLRWRIHTGSTSYSATMANSRMIYFRKLVELYPCEVIAPRFFGIARADFIAHLRGRDFERAQQVFEHMTEMLPFLNKSTRRRMALVAPLIKISYRTPFTSVVRGLLSFGTGRRSKSKKFANLLRVAAD